MSNGGDWHRGHIAPDWRRGRLAEPVGGGLEAVPAGTLVSWRPAIADPVWHVEVQLPSGTYRVLDRAAIMTNEQLAIAGYDTNYDGEHRIYIELVRGAPTTAACRACDWNIAGHTERVLEGARAHTNQRGT